MRFANSNRQDAAQMAPLLRSIAKEVVERSFAILKLENESKVLEESAGGPEPDGTTLFARLANQKRELRHSVEELRDLGWERDPEQPLTFRSRGLGGETTYTWRPEDSFFYRSAQI